MQINIMVCYRVNTFSEYTSMKTLKKITSYTMDLKFSYLGFVLS